MTPSTSSTASSPSSAPRRGPQFAPLRSPTHYQALPPQAAHDAAIVCDSAAWEPDESDLDIVMSIDSLDPLDPLDRLDSALTSPISAVIHPVGQVDPVDPVNADPVGSVDASRRTQRPMTPLNCFGQTTPSVRARLQQRRQTYYRYYMPIYGDGKSALALRLNAAKGGTSGAMNAAAKASAGVLEDYQRLLHAYLPRGVTNESLDLPRACFFPAPNPKRAFVSTLVSSHNCYYPSPLKWASGKSLKSGTDYTAYNNDVKSEPDLQASFRAISGGSPKAHLLIATAKATNTTADVVRTETTGGRAVTNPNTTSSAAATHSNEDPQWILALRSGMEDFRPETTQRTAQAEAQEEGAHDGRSNRMKTIDDGGGNLTVIGGECGSEGRRKKRKVSEAEAEVSGFDETGMKRWGE